MSTPAPGNTEKTDPPSGPWCGISHAADRTGVPATTLRTWARRYGFDSSGTSDGGHRRFCEDDLRRIELVVQLLAVGVTTQSAIAVAAGASPREVAERMTVMATLRISNLDGG